MPNLIQDSLKSGDNKTSSDFFWIWKISKKNKEVRPTISDWSKSQKIPKISSQKGLNLE